MDDRTILLTLRLIHFLAGLFWVGGTLIMAGFIVPALRTAGPEAGRFMEQLMRRRRLPIYMNVAAALTILSGFTIYGRFAEASAGQWPGTPPGIVFGIGGLAALLGAIVGGTVAAPTGRKLAALGQTLAAGGSPPTPSQGVEMSRLQARLGIATKIVASLLLMSVAAMATARYL